MKFTFISTAVLILLLVASCSNPSPEAQNYIKNGKTNVTNQSKTSNTVVDVTNQASSTAPGAANTLEPSPNEKLGQTVSSGTYAKSIDQFAGAKKVWEEMLVTKKKTGDTQFLFEMDNKAFINGNPLVEMKASLNPVPLFETWDTSKLLGVDQIISLISHGTQVQIKSRRMTPEGNWYLVTVSDSGSENIKGWLPEKLLSNMKAIPAGELGVPNEPQPPGPDTRPGSGRRGRGGGS